MATNPVPPSTETLRRFQLGTLPPGEAETVGNWVSENSGAAETLAHVGASDQLTHALAEPAPSNDCPESLVDATIHTLAQGGMPSLFGKAAPSIPDELGEYSIVRMIGSGGMGVVLEAIDNRLKRPVAIKLIGDDVASDPTVRDRFFREAQAVARIEHENVVPVLHVGEDGGRPYFVMPLLRGEALDSRLKREQPLPVDGVRRLARQVAAGLAAAHAVGLIHRDIKPGNIWLDTEKGRVRLLDFGLVKPVETADTEKALTRSGAVMGTPHYMSPEQAMGGEIDHRSDLFSLGVVLYEAATGLKPFKAETTFGVLHALMTHTPADPHSVNPAIPKHLSAVIMKLLAKDAEDRFATAEEVIAALAEPVVAPQPKRQRRTLRNWIVTAGLLFAIGVVFAVVYQLQLKTKDGTLIVEVSGDADVRFKNGELLIYGEDGKLKYTLKPGDRNAKLAAGTYTVKVIGADGVVLNTPEFTMTKDGQVTLRVIAMAPQPKSGEPPVVVQKDPPPADDRKAAEWVVSIGGVVQVNNEIREIRNATDLPREHFRLTRVALVQNPRVTDASVANLKGCTKLKRLDLDVTQIGDEGLAHLKDCTELEVVGLSYTKIDEGAMQTVQHWKKLTGLNLAWTGVGDSGLALLKDHTSLRWLHLGGSKVTDKGLVHIEGFHQLRNLSVERTKVTLAELVTLSKKLPYCMMSGGGGERIEPPNWKDRRDAEDVILLGGVVRVNGEERERKTIADLPKESFRLTWVSLKNNPRVGDAELVFRDCQNVKHLDLSGTKVTDGALRALKDDKNFVWIDVTKTGVTNVGVKDFAAALPTCTIVWDGGTIEPREK